MPADLPLSRRPAPPARSGGYDSPIRGVLLGMAIGTAVMLILGLTWLVIDKFHALQAARPAALAATATPIPGGAGFALRTPEGQQTTQTMTNEPAGGGLNPSPTQTVAATTGAGSSPTGARSAKPAPTHIATQASSATAAPKATLKPGAPQPSVTPTPFTYTVQPGDSLYQIASRFGVDVLDLMIANHIANPSLIQPGQVFTIPGPGTVARGPQATGPKSILVDISQQHLYAYQGNTLVYSFIVSTGAYDGTLRGSFEILDKLPNPYSDVWNFWMPDWLGFYYASGLENGFHALPVLPDGSQIWGDTLGTPSSYGCVVLGTLEAQLLYAWADVGTPVTVR